MTASRYRFEPVPPPQNESALLEVSNPEEDVVQAQPLYVAAARKRIRKSLRA
jgi:hypothetical protein